jgi:hypothetical protein
MAHWAEIDQDNIVVRVTVGDNNDPNGDEGFKWLVENLGGRWVQTSYNANFRKQFAGIGFSYDEEADVFIAPQPYPSWSLDENYDWQAPVPKPDNQFTYSWDENSQQWVLVNFSEIG